MVWPGSGSSWWTIPFQSHQTFNITFLGVNTGFATVCEASPGYDQDLIRTLHSNLDLMRVSGMAYTKSRLTLDFSKCKQSGPYELLSSCRLTVASKRITRCVFAEWKRVQKICLLARTHKLLIKTIYEDIFNFFRKWSLLLQPKLF